jgi:hypothetical protein
VCVWWSTKTKTKEQRQKRQKERSRLENRQCIFSAYKGRSWRPIYLPPYSSPHYTVTVQYMYRNMLLPPYSLHCDRLLSCWYMPTLPPHSLKRYLPCWRFLLLFTSCLTPLWPPWTSWSTKCPCGSWFNVPSQHNRDPCCVEMAKRLLGLCLGVWFVGLVCRSIFSMLPLTRVLLLSGFASGGNSLPVDWLASLVVCSLASCAVDGVVAVPSSMYNSMMITKRWRWR